MHMLTRSLSSRVRQPRLHARVPPPRCNALHTGGPCNPQHGSSMPGPRPLLHPGAHTPAHAAPARRGRPPTLSCPLDALEHLVPPVAVVHGLRLHVNGAVGADARPALAAAPAKELLRDRGPQPEAAAHQDQLDERGQQQRAARDGGKHACGGSGAAEVEGWECGRCMGTKDCLHPTHPAEWHRKEPENPGRLATLPGPAAQQDPTRAPAAIPPAMSAGMPNSATRRGRKTEETEKKAAAAAMATPSDSAENTRPPTSGPTSEATTSRPRPGSAYFLTSSVGSRRPTGRPPPRGWRRPAQA